MYAAITNAESVSHKLATVDAPGLGVGVGLVGLVDVGFRSTIAVIVVLPEFLTNKHIT